MPYNYFTVILTLILISSFTIGTQLQAEAVQKILTKISETTPSYCHIRIIFNSNFENEHFPQTKIEHFMSLSLFQFKLGLTVHKGLLNDTYKRFFNFHSKYTNCTLNLIAPTTSSSTPEFNTTLIHFLHESIRLLILEPIHWTKKTTQDYKLLKVTASQFNLVLFPFTMADVTSIRNTTLYLSSFSHEKYSLNNFGVTFLPTSDSSDIELCMQNQGFGPTIHNMTCQSVKNFSVSYFKTLGNPPRQWAAFVNGDDAYGGVLKSNSYCKLPSIVSYSQNYEMYLLSEMLNYSNVSLVNEDSFPEQKVHVNLDLVATFRLKRPPTFSLVNTDSIHFLTCYSRPILSFHLYVDPFDVTLWLAILFTLLSLAILTNLMLFLSNTNSSFWSSNTVSPPFYLLSTILGQSGEEFLPTRLRLSLPFRLATGLWILNLVVLSNIYLSRVIVQLNSPVKVERLDYYGDIVCPSKSQFSKEPCSSICNNELATYSILDLINDWQRIQQNNNFSDYITNHSTENPPSKNCFSLLSQPVNPSSFWDSENNKTPMNYEFFRTLFKLATEFLMTQFVMQSRDGNNPMTGKLFSSWLPFRRYFPRELIDHGSNIEFPYLTESVIEAELVDCGKSAFVGEESVVSAEFDYLKNNYERRPFHRGSVGYAGIFSGWAFQQPGHSPMPRVFRQILEGGIMGLLVKYNRMTRYFQRKEGTSRILRGKLIKLSSVKALGLDGSIQTIFILWAALQATNIVAFTAEICIKAFNQNSNRVLLLSP
jgi:hypothetical protein